MHNARRQGFPQPHLGCLHSENSQRPGSIQLLGPRYSYPCVCELLSTSFASLYLQHERATYSYHAVLKINEQVRLGKQAGFQKRSEYKWNFVRQRFSLMRFHKSKAMIFPAGKYSWHHFVFCWWVHCNRNLICSWVFCYRANICCAIYHFCWTDSPMHSSANIFANFYASAATANSNRSI